MGMSNRGPKGLASLLSSTALVLPMAMPEMILATGTWKHPNPGQPITITVLLIGGGGGGGGPYDGTNGGTDGSGGGGSGRIVISTLVVTTDQPVVIGAGGAIGATNSNGAAGGTTSFGSLSAAGGSPGQHTVNPSTGIGGAGGFGGGGAYAAAGGEGLDFTGGGGGLNSGAAGRSAFGPNSQPGAASSGGWPNGANLGTRGGLGGDPSLLFPQLLGYGAGGRGCEYAVANGLSGKQGAVLVWINRS